MGLFGDILSGIGSAVGLIPGVGNILKPVGAIASAIGAGSSAASLADKNAQAQIDATRMSNETNLQIAQGHDATNLEQTRLTNEANAALASQQNQWNIDQWNRENEYNSPANQVKLLREAGINPALAIGDNPFNAASSVQSAELANQNAAHVEGDAHQIPEYAQRTSRSERILDKLQQSVTINKLDAENKQAIAAAAQADEYTKYIKGSMTANSDALTEQARQQAALYFTQSNHIRNIEPFQQNVLDATSRELDSRSDLNRKSIQTQDAQINHYNAETERLLLSNKWIDKESAVKIRESLSRVLFNQASAYNQNQMAELNNVIAQCREEDLKWLKDTSYWRQQQEFVKWRKAMEEKKEVQWRNHFREQYGFDPSVGMFDAIFQRDIQGVGSWSDWTVPGVRGFGSTAGNLIQNVPYMFIGNKLSNPQFGGYPPNYFGYPSYSVPTPIYK